MADAYDAMTSVRAYSAPQTKDYITAEIREGRGRQFDPKIADIVLRLLDEGFFDAYGAAADTENVCPSE